MVSHSVSATVSAHYYGEKQSKTSVPLFYSCFDQAMSAWNFFSSFYFKQYLIILYIYISENTDTEHELNSY